MIAVDQAQARILAALACVGAETVGLAQATGRTLAVDLVAKLTQPPAAVSAMDGYAVRAADIASAPAPLRQIGAAPAGHPFAGNVGPGECVRIFTGAIVPDGADTILIQENAEADGETVLAKQSEPKGRYVRPAGLDFAAGQVLLPAGTVMGPRQIGLAAASNHAWLEVRRRPRVAILATGDEIVLPGNTPLPGQIVSSNSAALAAFVEQAGGIASVLPIAPDTAEALQALAAGARGADLLVTSGGASVGDHDLVRTALGQSGLALDFWQIAMRPGKPLMFGRYGDVALLGLPGNPVSSLVCAVLFLGPILRRLLGQANLMPTRTRAKLGAALGANDSREDYLRAKIAVDESGNLIATPFPRQDSAMLTLLATADALVVRRPHAAPAQAGDTVEIVPL
jgi:molybdopterin molybdotransferase